MSLFNLSINLSDVGRHEEVLAANQEATQLYRQLANDRPAVFLGDLINCLDVMFRCLSQLGHTDEAQVAQIEADELRCKTTPSLL